MGEQILPTLRLFGVILSFWIFQPVHSGAGNVWEYKGPLGPEHWKIDYPMCGGDQQSPIHVMSKQLVIDGSLEDFNLTDFSNISGVSMLLKNVGGHTVEVLLSGDPMYVRGGSLKGDYILEQLHFHWGLKDERGSEHVIDGYHFPMEMHIVLYNDKFANLSSALDKEDGLAVLAFFFKIGEENKKFMNILNHFANIKFKDTSTPIPSFPLTSLLPSNVNSWIRYEGSLTTPPCFQTVTWTLFMNKITIAEHQIEEFRHILKNYRGQRSSTLVDDFRPLQSLNHRRVYTNNRSLITNGNNKVIVHFANNMVFLIAVVNLHKWFL